MWTRGMIRAIEEASRYCRLTYEPHPLTVHDRKVLEDLGVKSMDDKSSIYDVDIYCAEGPCLCRAEDEGVQCKCTEEDDDDGS